MDREEKIKTIRDMTPDEMQDLLISMSISTEAASALRKADFDGQSFWTWEIQDYKNLKELEPELAPALQAKAIISICKARDAQKEFESKKDELENFLSKSAPKAESYPAASTSNGGSELLALLKASPIGSSTTKSTAPEGRQGPVRREQARKFGSPVEATKYTYGNIIGTETGISNLLEPTREFKEFEIEEMTDDAAMEKAFVKRVGIFTFACLNSRCNGTLYLGIADSTKGEYYDGFIKGVSLSENLKTKLQDIMDRHFTGRDPESLRRIDSETLAAIQNCIKPLQFIPVTKGTRTNDLYIVEVDVEPRGHVCNDLRFYMNVRKERPSKKSKTGKSEITYEPTYYLREGSRSNSYKGDQLSEFSKKVEVAIKRRDEEEKEAKKKQTSAMDRLEYFMCRGRRSSGNLDDKSHRYILLSNGVPLLHTFEWIRNIDWFMVMDFETCEDGDGKTSQLYQHYMKGKIMHPSFRQGQDLTNCLCRRNGGSSRDFMNGLRVGENTVFLSCGESPLKDTPSWFKDVLPGITALLMNLFDPERLDTTNDVVVMTLLGSDIRLEEMSLVLKELVKLLHLDQIVCLYEDSSKITELDNNVKQCFGTSWHKQAIQVVWPQLNAFMKAKTETNIFSGHKVISSTGAMVDFPPELLAPYDRDKVFILSANECEEIMYSDSCQQDEYCKFVEAKTLEFLSGKSPEWCVYFFLDPNIRAAFKPDMPPGIVDRDITLKILEELNNLTKSKEKCVARLCLNHHPGSGATTIGRGILWQLRKKMRCVMISGKDFKSNDDIEAFKIQRAAKRILGFRAFQETDDVIKGKNPELTCKPVLILFDNCDDSMARLLTTHIEREVEMEGITFKRTMFLMIYLKCAFEPEFFAREEKRSVFIIEQALSDEEQRAFALRLKALKGFKAIEPKDMLSFVIMAENFNEKSSYVEGLVRKVLMDIYPIYENQGKVLLYLSILKYFSDSSLPSYHCKKMAFSISESLIKKGKDGKELPDEVISKWKTFSPPAKMFLSEDDGFTTDREHRYSAYYSFMEITHKPIAYQLFASLVKDTTLASVVQQMMDEKVLIEQPFLRELIQSTFKKLLVKRDFDDAEDGGNPGRQQRKVSNLIKYIIEHSSKEEAVNLLKFGLEVLTNSDHKAAVSQTIARVHLLYYQMDDAVIDEAKKFAAEASRLAPEYFAVSDTEGQVYKRHLKYLLEKQKSECNGTGYMLSNCNDILNIGSEASRLFKKAQDLYMSTKMQFGRSSKPQNIIDEAVVDHDISNDYPGLFGQIETNLLVARCILQSKDLRQAELSEMFIKVLRKERVEFDLPSLFVGVELDWKKHHSFICDLFSLTERCLQNTTRKLTYNAIQLDNTNFRWTMERLQRFNYDFRDMFGVKAGGDWRKYVEKSKVPKKAKLAFLRQFLSAGITISFGWVMRSDCLTLQEYRDYLVKMAEIADDNAAMVAGDKISYANVYFAYLYQDNLENCRQLSLQKVKDFCEGLVLEDADYPEPYFFYLLLFWPPMELASGSGGHLRYKEVSPQRLDLLKKCMVRLSHFEDQLADGHFKGGVYIHSKSAPIFFYQKSRQASLPITTAKRVWWQMISKNSLVFGRLNDKKGVDISFEACGSSREGAECNVGDSSPCLTIRPANLYTRGKPWVKTVNFVLAFTFSGPVAFGITDEDDELRHIKEASTPKSS